MPGLDRKWWTLIAVCTAMFMLLLDITVVNVALPDIQRSLHASFSDLQWVIDAYSLTLAAFLLTAGVIGDMFGRRSVFAIGLGRLLGLVARVRAVDLLADAQPVPGRPGRRRRRHVRHLPGPDRRRPSRAGSAAPPSASTARSSAAPWPSDRWWAGPSPAASAGGGSSSSTCPSASSPSSSPSPGCRNPRTRTPAGSTGSASSPSPPPSSCSSFALVRGNDDGWGSALIVGLLVGSAVLLAVFLVAEWRQSRSHARPDPVQASGHGRRRRSPPSPSPPRSSPCSCTSPSSSRTTSATARWPPACASCPSPCSPSSSLPSPASSTVRIHSRLLLSTGLCSSPSAAC